MQKRSLVLAASLAWAGAALGGPVCLERASFTTPTSRFIPNDDATAVMDSETRLIWQRCPLGQTLNDADTLFVLEDDTCSQPAAGQSWSAALLGTVAFNTQQASAGLPGDWRLPNRKELATIEELKCVFPAINSLVFPGAQSGVLLWSSSAIADAESTSVWVLDVWNGGIASAVKTSTRLARLVRGPT